MALEKQFDVYGVGNALVDILAFADDAFVQGLGFPKGSMNLVDTEKRTAILDGLTNAELEMQCGGSAANSMIAIAQSKGSGIFVGKVASDEKGTFYIKDMRGSGIQYNIEPAGAGNDPTGTSIILTTPDAERTMCTHLGVSVHLQLEDIKAEDVAKCQICYIEGYLWTGPETKAAALKTMDVARENNTQVSFTFSDPFLVNAFADDFKMLVKEKCDIIFCNADEARSFIGEQDIDACAKQIGEMVETAFITDGKDGAIVVHQGTIDRVEGFQVQAIDTVGAGDSFAGGVLYGLTHGYTHVQAARWGNYLASEVVTVQGPRLESGPSKSISEILGL